jgi:aspartate-semialdehyde dehydrogenase
MSRFATSSTPLANTAARQPDLQDPGLLASASYIDGQWVEGAEAARLAVLNPVDGAVIAEVAALDEAGARRAVDAADKAFPGWAALLPQQRSDILRRWFELMREHKEDLALIMTLEQGKPLSEARGEIDYGSSFAEYFAEEAKRPDIMSVTSHLPNAEVELWREPLGVAALVTPWNFPNAMLTRKAAAALAVGCTVVAHPSKETPLSALALAELAQRAGFPAGVFNVVIGEAPVIVGAWCEDTRVRALSFTGSTEIGRLLYAQCAPSIKRLSLELGGHAPFIVFADADLDRAVDEAVKAKFATSGQDCLGANRFYIERPVYAEFCRRFTERTEALVVGPGLDDPDIGPLMHARAVAKQQEQVADAVAQGARLLCGGEAHPLGPLFYKPTVLADVPDSAKIMREETFGPVAALTPFDGEAEVIHRANSTEFGLVAYLHTKEPARIYRLSRALVFGMVAVNRTKVTGAPIPFGGMKQSGLGREGSRLGIEAFSDVKYVCRDWS